MEELPPPHPGPFTTSPNKAFSNTTDRPIEPIPELPQQDPLPELLQTNAATRRKACLIEGSEATGISLEDYTKTVDDFKWRWRIRRKAPRSEPGYLKTLFSEYAKKHGLR